MHRAFAFKRVALGTGVVGSSFAIAHQATNHDRPASFTSGLCLGYLYYHCGGVFQRCVDGETSHNLAVRVASWPPSVRRALGLVNTYPDPTELHTTVLGLDFTNPIGIAAGFDKHGEAIDGILDMGFGFSELGSVTPLAQPGNARPRVFRLVEDQCIINRYGFNSEGHQAVRARLQARRAHLLAHGLAGGVVGVNLGKNKTSETPVGDYVLGVQELGEFADYLVVNVSSPNTPGLRAMQGKETLRDLLSQVKAARDGLRVSPLPPLLVKIAPDLQEVDKDDIADVVLEVGMDGIIVSNTTIARPPSLRSEHAGEMGGLSGPVLMEPSTKLIAAMHRRTGGKVPIIGVGGVSSGLDAYRKIRAGASLVQLYTGFAYKGPELISRIKGDMVRLLKADGLTVAEAVGIDAQKLK